MRFKIIFSLLIIFQTVLAKEIKLTPFQKNIKQCLKFNFDIQKVQNLNQLYDVIDKQYPLKTTETIYREIQYKDKNEMRKLKLEKGIISIYKVTDEDTLKLLNNDARQKGLTDDSSINQLLQNADIRGDWVNVKEVRSDQTLVYFGRERDQFKSITWQQLGHTSKLECTNKESSDICFCR